MQPEEGDKQVNSYIAGPKKAENMKEQLFDCKLRLFKASIVLLSENQINDWMVPGWVAFKKALFLNQIVLFFAGIKLK